jgi:hypothetical protein
MTYIIMTRNQTDEREQLEILVIDQLVPDDHLVRKIEAAIDFTFIYLLVENLYSGLGRPSFQMRRKSMVCDGHPY